MADADYIIDIAATMPDGELTVSQLDALTSKLQTGGRESDSFSAAIKKVSDRLDDARRATAAINGELEDARSAFHEHEKAAVRASKAVERAMRKGEVPPELVAQLDAANDRLASHARHLKEVEGRAGRAADAERELSGSLRKIRMSAAHVDKALGNSTRRVSTFRGALGDVGGPAGELGERLLKPVQAFVDLNEEFGRTRALAIVAGVALASMAAIIVAGTAIVIGLVAAVSALVVKFADSRREARLSQEALEAMNPRLRELRGEFKSLTNETGVSADRLRALEEKLRDARVSAAQMPKALRAAAQAEAALGEGGADKFVGDIKAGKLAVDEFARNTQQKLGGIVERRMLGLGAQTDRLKRNFGGLFAALEIEPALKAYQRFVDMFDETSAIGGALKTLFEKFFQPIIDGAEDAFTVVEAFVLGFLIGLTKIYIALKPVIKAVGDFLGFDDRTFLDLLGDAEAMGKAAAGVFAVLAGIVAIAGAQFVIMGKAVSRAVGFIVDTPWRQIGTDIVDGMVDGIKSAASRVWDAISGMTEGALKVAKRVLDIGSPSKEMRAIGRNSGESYAMGVEDETPAAERAVAGLVEPPPAPSYRSGGGAPSGAPAAQQGAARGDAQATAPSAAPAINLSGARFEFYGVEGAEDAEARFSGILTRLLEGDVAALGAGEAG